MTHPQTIVEWARRRDELLASLAVTQSHHADAIATAAEHADAARQFTEQVRDLSRVLRDLDPEHAEEYPDRAEGRDVAAQLRWLACQLEGARLPQGGKPYITVDLHLPGEDARGVVQLLAAAGGWDTSEHESSRVWLRADASQGGVSVRVNAWVEDGEPSGPVGACCWVSELRGGPCASCTEPFIQASPAEVAEAYASSARHALDVVELGERAADALSAAEAVHMMPFTPSGRDSGHAFCGSPEGPVATNDEDVTCGDCLKQQNRQYTAARGRKAVAR